MGWTLGGGFALKFKASNILDLPVKRKAGDLVQSTFSAGRTFGLGLKYSPGCEIGCVHLSVNTRTLFQTPHTG